MSDSKIGDVRNIIFNSVYDLGYLHVKYKKIGEFIRWGVRYPTEKYEED